MLVVSMALAAVLIAESGGSDAGAPQGAGPASAPKTLVATPTNTPDPTATPEPTPVPELSSELKVRLNGLPEKLRTETLSAYDSGTLSEAQLQQIVTDYENRNPSVRVGSVIGATDGLLRFEVYTTGERVEVATFDQTLIRRGEAPIALEDLLLDELVMVVSTDEGATALTIDAFGVVAP